jgi:flagellar hook-length control protein FliK
LAAAAGPIAAANPQLPDVSAAVASQTSQVDLLRDEPMPMATEAASVLAAPGVADLRAAVGMQSVAPPGPPASTTALAEAISRQMAQGVVDRPEAEGLVEIALDPPELGRVRLSFSDVGGALTLAITAERPETAELMRRHLSLLVEQFQKAGLDAPNVDINDRDGGNARERGSAQTRVDVATPAQIEDRAGVVRPTAFGRASDGLDLRL